MRYPIRTSGTAPRRGIALIAVLVVVAVLALAAYRFSDLMMAEYQAADSYQRSVQSRTLADAAVNYAAALLADPNQQTVINGNPYDNASLFQDILVQDDEEPRRRGRFSIVSPLDPDTAYGNSSGSGGGGASELFRYGVIDEGGKLNINALFKLDSSGQTLYNVLMQLPNMTDDVANSIVYWIDPNATPRSSGATDNYYSSLQPPYNAKHAPLDTLDELLYVSGVTPALLFGNDTNRNGQLDPEEAANDATGSGTLDLGWQAYLTVYSRELNVSSTGLPRIYINDKDLNDLYQNLTDAGFDDTIASFIVLARQYGVTSTSSSGSGGTGSGAASSGGSGGGTNTKTPQIAPSSPGQNNNSSGGSRATRSTLGSNLSSQGGSNSQTITSLYSLVNATVTIPASGNTPAQVYQSPMNSSDTIKQYLPTVLDQLTTKRNAVLPGRVNANTAPTAVLSALAPQGTPLLDAATVQTIVSTRPSFTGSETPDPIFQTGAWLITEAGLTASQMQTLEQYLTVNAQVYRLQAIGHFDGGGPSARVEAVVDTNAGRPRIVYYRDLTSLGRGFDLPKNN